MNTLGFYREKALLTKTKLSKLSQVPRSTVIYLEQGIKHPTVSTATKLALTISRCLNTPIAPDQLFSKFHGVHHE